MFEAHAAGPPGAALELLHPEVEYDTTARLDGGIWHGHEGVRHALSEWTDSWQDWTLEVERYIDAGEGRVVVLWRERGRVKSSGSALAQEGVSVCTVREGLIVQIVVDLDRRRALRSLGLAAE